MDSVDIFHGLSGHCPVQSSLTLPTESVDIVLTLALQFTDLPEKVHGQCPLSPWTFYRWGQLRVDMQRNG